MSGHPASFAAADPDRYMRGFQGLVDDTGQGISDRVQIHGVFQPGRERGHGVVGVVAGTVEPPVHGIELGSARPLTIGGSPR
jgi:hypothetical protein